jgi:hypothetical protein
MARSDTRRWLKLGHDKTEVPEDNRRPVAALLSRGLLRFRAFHLQGLRSGDMDAALRSHVLAWQPFADPEVRVTLRDGQALAWAWDRRDVQARLGEAGLPQARILLEPLQREPLAAGLRLVEGQDGFDAECWKQGQLVASRWWPAMPDEGDWREFLRQLGPDGAAAAAAPPQAQAAPLRAAAWAPARSLSQGDGRASAGEAVAWKAGLLLCVAASAAAGHQWWEAREHLGELRAELAAAKAGNGATLAARDEALNLSAQSAQVVAAVGAVQPLELLHHLQQLLPAEAVMKEFDLTADKLKLGLDLPSSLARSTLIQRLQAGAWLRDVHEIKASEASGNAVLQMRVDGLQAPLQAASAASSAASAGGGR